MIWSDHSPSFSHTARLHPAVMRFTDAHVCIVPPLPANGLGWEALTLCGPACELQHVSPLMGGSRFHSRRSHTALITEVARHVRPAPHLRQLGHTIMGRMANVYNGLHLRLEKDSGYVRRVGGVEVCGALP